MAAQPSSQASRNRAKNRDVENENMKPGSPPRPATEPAGAQGSQDSAKTKTDPGSGRAH